MTSILGILSTNPVSGYYGLQFIQGLKHRRHRTKIKNQIKKSGFDRNPVYSRIGLYNAVAYPEKLEVGGHKVVSQHVITKTYLI